MTTTEERLLDITTHPRHLCSHAIWTAWRRLLEANAALFLTNPRGNLSVDGNAMAEIFRGYLQSRLRGAVLDIGCGPQPKPSYLRGYPDELITGIDPLIMELGSPNRIPAIAERLPFVGESFTTAIAATSLDHLLNINAALAEVYRVLVPGGRFVCWVRYWPGSPIYDPFGAVNAPDPHHLYHLDTWFEWLAVQAGFRLSHSFTYSTPKPGTFLTHAKP